MLEFQSIKIFLLKDTVKIGLKKFLWLKKIGIQYLGLKKDRKDMITHLIVELIKMSIKRIF